MGQRRSVCRPTFTHEHDTGVHATPRMKPVSTMRPEGWCVSRIDTDRYEKEPAKQKSLRFLRGQKGSSRSRRTASSFESTSKQHGRDAIDADGHKEDWQASAPRRDARKDVPPRLTQWHRQDWCRSMECPKDGGETTPPGHIEASQTGCMPPKRSDRRRSPHLRRDTPKYEVEHPG